MFGGGAVVGAFALDVHGGMALLHGNEYFALNEQDTLLAQREIDAGGDTPGALRGPLEFWLQPGKA